VAMRAAAAVGGAQGFSGGAVRGTPVGEEATLGGQGMVARAEWSGWRELGGAEVTDAKRGKLEFDVHPL
jgi:hypothetical protein